MQTSLVSISLVSFNQGAFISQAIESCLMQEVDFEYKIIIHDDASSDDTSQIIREFAEKYPEKIIPVIQTENQWSKGIEIIDKFIIPKANSKYVAFLESDDYWIDPHKLQTQIDFLENNPNIAMCFTATKHIFPNSTKSPKLKRYKKHDEVCTEKDVIRWGGSLLDMCSVVVKRSIFDDAPDWYFHSQLWDLTVPLLSLLHGKVFYLDRVSATYRYLVSGSWTQKNVREYERRKRNRMKVIRVTDGFDQETEQQYHRFVRGRLTPLIVEVLLLSKKEDEDFTKLYSRLSFFSKLEYHFFNLLGSLRLWEIYRFYRRIVTGY